MSSTAFLRVCEAVQNLEVLCDRGIGVHDLSIFGCLWSLGTVRLGYVRSIDSSVVFDVYMDSVWVLRKKGTHLYLGIYGPWVLQGTLYMYEVVLVMPHPFWFLTFVLTEHVSQRALFYLLRHQHLHSDLLPTVAAVVKLRPVLRHRLVVLQKPPTSTSTKQVQNTLLDANSPNSSRHRQKHDVFFFSATRNKHISLRCSLPLHPTLVVKKSAVKRASSSLVHSSLSSLWVKGSWVRGGRVLYETITMART